MPQPIFWSTELVYTNAFSANGGSGGGNNPIGFAAPQLIALASGQIGTVTISDTDPTNTVDLNIIYREMTFYGGFFNYTGFNGAPANPSVQVNPATPNTPGWDIGRVTTGLTNGNVVVVWSDPFVFNGPSTIYARILTPNGTPVGGPITVAQTTDLYQDYSVAALPGGGFVVTWDRDADPSVNENFNVEARIFTSTGAAVNAAFTAHSGTAGAQYFPNVITLNNGNIVVTWEGDSATGTLSSFRTFSSSGAPLSGDVALSTDPLDFGGKGVALAGGGFVVGYNDFNSVTGNSVLVANIYNASGASVGAPLTISAAVNIGNGEIVALQDGGFYVVWDMFSGNTNSVWGQRVTAAGALDGAAQRINANAAQSVTLADAGVVVSADGRIFVSYNNLTTNQAQYRILDPREAGMSFTGGVGADYRFGTRFADTLNGGDGADQLAGGGGADTINGGNGDDILFSNSIFPEDDFDDGANVMDGGAGNDQLRGSRSAETLLGGDGDDYIDGRGGADTINGGLGIDRAAIGPTGGATAYNADFSVILPADGLDPLGTRLISIESVRVRGSTVADTVTGGANADELFGNAGNDTLNGGGGDDYLNGEVGDDILQGGVGADTMIGGVGSDSYGVDASGDIVTENVNEGFDAVYASIDYRLGANVEQLTLTGSATAGYGNNDGNAITGTGFANYLGGEGGNDVLDGGAGDDIIDGQSGGDVMIGGLGNDSFRADSVFDEIRENVGEGFDAVYANSDYTLGANLEQLNLEGTAVAGYGNALGNAMYGTSAANYLAGLGGNDVIDGGAGDDIIDGGTGGDVLIGGLGNDSYRSDNVADEIRENPGGGFDAVYANADYTLGANIEQLNLEGAAVAGYGNELGNAIYGTSIANYLAGLGGNDVIDGGAGDDIIDGGIGGDVMIGGLGNDSFGVDSAADEVRENGGEGYDTVYAGVSFTLAANIEQLNLTGSAVSGVGNAQANSINGTAGANTLDGAAGNDILFGGAGDDTFIFRPGSGQDRISDFVAGGTDDRVDLSAYAGSGITYLLTQSGADALFTFSNGDTITLAGVTAANLVQSGDYWL